MIANMAAYLHNWRNYMEHLMFRTLFIVAILACTACGGQVSAKPANVCMQPSDRIVAMTGCDAVIQPTPELDPAKSAAQQAALGPVVIGWIGGNPFEKVTAQGAITPRIMSRAVAYINAMAPYSNIGWIYAADEFGWCDNRHCLTEYVPQLMGIANATHAVGKKVLISVLPGTIAQFPDAPLDGINLIDGISIDIYPSMMLAADFGACAYSTNPYETLLYCSIQKLRGMGFTGQIGYIAQGFKLTTDDPATLLAALLLQRQALSNASALGVTAVMSWGCHLGAPELAAEPYLVPLCNTQYEGLVTP